MLRPFALNTLGDFIYDYFMASFLPRIDLLGLFVCFMQFSPASGFQASQNMM